MKNKDKKKLNKTLWESTHILDKKDLEGVMSDSEVSDDKSDGYRYCEIGHWVNETVYKAIHTNAKFLALKEEEMKSAVYINQQLYRRYYTLLSNNN